MYKKSDLDSIYNLISNIDLLELFENKIVQEMYDKLTFCNEKACNFYIPIKSVSNNTNNQSPWISISLESLIRYIHILSYKNCRFSVNNTN
jgi:hypothetical protein